MKKIIETFLKQQTNVGFAYLFGSQADASANENSDIDIAVFLEEVTFDNKLSLHHDLEKLLIKDVDLVILNEVKNLFLLESILDAQTSLKNSEKQDAFELESYHAIEDFKAFQRSIYVA